MVISDRPKKVVHDWFGSLDIITAAESGLFVRMGPHHAWERRDSPGQRAGVGVQAEDSWRDVVLPLLQYFTDRTPGSFVERKEASLMWHYLDADVNFGMWQAKDMQLQLEELLVSYPLEVRHGGWCPRILLTPQALIPPPTYSRC